MSQSSTKPGVWRWIVRAVVGSTVLAMCWIIASYAMAHYLTRRTGSGVAAEEAIPDCLANKVEAFRLETSDGQKLGAWYLPGREQAPVVVLLHGNGGSRTTCIDQALLLQEAGMAVLLPTLRAHGDSTGEMNDYGYSARQDVIAAVNWIRKKEDRPLVIWGQSLGSAAALFAAKELGTQVQGYILECPFADLRTAVRNRTRLRLPMVLDSVAYAGLVAVAPLVLPQFDDISPKKAAHDVPREIPVLLLAGGQDQRATPEEAQAIAEQIPGKSEVVVFESAQHLQLLVADATKYRQKTLDFIQRCGKNR